MKPRPRCRAVGLPDFPSVRGVEQKRCARCGKMKLLGEHGAYTYVKKYHKGDDTWYRHPQGQCKKCAAERALRWRDGERAAGRMKERERGWKQAIRDDPRRAQAERDYQREYSTARRRKERGVGEYVTQVKAHTDDYQGGRSYPAHTRVVRTPRPRRSFSLGPDRRVEVAPLLEWLATQERSTVDVCEIAGLDRELLDRAARDDRRGVYLSTVDRVLTALDRRDVMAELYSIDDGRDTGN